MKATSFWRDNRLLLREFKHFRWIAILAVICSLTGAMLEGGTVGLIASFLQGLTDPNEPPIQTGLSWFDVHFLATEASPTRRIYQLSALVLLAIWLRSGFSYLGQLYSRLAQIHLSDRFRKLIFEQLQSLSLSYYSKTHTGELINSMTSEAVQLQQAFAVVSDLLTRGATLLAYMFTMFCLSWQLSTFVIMAFSLLSVGLSTLIAQVREASFELPKVSGQFSSIVIEFISGIQTVHASAAQDFERRQFYKVINQMMKAKVRVSLRSELVKPLAEGISSTILIVISVVAFNIFIINGELRSASLLTFMFVLFRMMPLVSQVNQSRANFSSFQGTLSHVKELLRKDNKTYLKDGKIQFIQLQKSIDFISVDFGYNIEEPVLCNVTLSIQKGQTTALVGASGAGKTTLANLIPRFYDPIQGQILIDGVDLRALEINTLRRRMAIVSQEAFIFNASVRSNIAYGFAEVDEAEIQKAAQLANAWEFIQEMPEGFNTKLGDRGVRLSGGQRQRIAIARALLRNPEILILDEATSALDSVTEQLIQESLEKLSTGRTVITIAHRLSTIARADKVIVLEQGKIVEQGNYQELLERRGELWKYHHMQYKSNQTG